MPSRAEALAPWALLAPLLFYIRKLTCVDGPALETAHGMCRPLGMLPMRVRITNDITITKPAATVPIRRQTCFDGPARMICGVLLATTICSVVSASLFAERCWFSSYDMFLAYLHEDETY